MMYQAWSHPMPEHAMSLRGWFTPPTGKPVIHFLHGNGFCGRSYDPMLAVLATEFDLWLTDLQGHGESDIGRGFLGWNANAEIAARAFNAHRDVFGRAPVFAVGHSFGGVLTSLMLANQPSLFQRAVLLDPVLFTRDILAAISLTNLFGMGKLTPFARSAMQRTQDWPNRAAAMAHLKERGTFRSWSSEALQAYVDHALRDSQGGRVGLKCAPATEATIYHTTPRRLWPSIRGISTPTLIIHGTHTMPFVKRAVRRATALNARISAREEAGGHCFMQEDPERAALLIRRFLLGSN
ncbi:alpha/beta hydrolase [Burkholderia sp. BCC1977]|uniref:alpha/beta fold hydrolase n=1 Tax=Burkholderia sp. BCC1977 TaxID=2817440 RepID=UPI002ABD56A5|nr:alpha/beta hydrolase [Burkholderia sp. BCC1977]